MSDGSSPLTLRPDAARIAGVHVLADDDPRWKWDPTEQARAACEGGAAVVQLRAKHATDPIALEHAQAIREITSRTGTLFFVNARFDLALAADADGVHLGQDDLPPARLPDAARRRLLVGFSTHTTRQARDAALQPIDYVAFGPVFRTASKASEYDARGLEALTDVVAMTGAKPVVAIGGISVSNAALVRDAGAAAVAVISAVAAEDDPVAATRALVRAFAVPGSPAA